MTVRLSESPVLLAGLVIVVLASDIQAQARKGLEGTVDAGCGKSNSARDRRPRA